MKSNLFWREKSDNSAIMGATLYQPRFGRHGNTDPVSRLSTRNIKTHVVKYHY